MSGAHAVLAARITWGDDELLVTDTPPRINAALYADGMWEARILNDVRWAESARHPYQTQGGELDVGAITLANADGQLDSFVAADITGARVDLRRGLDSDRWADLEPVFVARVAGTRINGRSEIELELKTALERLAGPVVDNLFEDVPFLVSGDQQLVTSNGKEFWVKIVQNSSLSDTARPFVIGRVRQAAALEVDPADLRYLTAQNTTRVISVAEGGNATDNWVAEPPHFRLTASPTLQITADFENDESLTYATAVPYILATAGIDPAVHLDQASITAHDAAAGSPEIGWLVRGDTSVDQLLFRLAGSLGGYVWQGLDGRIRSQRLAAPTDPGGEVLTIDGSRADVEDVTSYDDPAPRLSRAVRALRNWQPIDLDRQAGITSEWSEADRAAAAAQWRYTRLWSSTVEQRSAFARRWPAVATREPYATALLTPDDAQQQANQAGLWANKPRFYEIPTEVLIGELDQVAVGSVVRVELDYPGLNGVWMLVMGREGGARPGTVNLTLWS